MRLVVPAIFWALALLSGIAALSGGLIYVAYAILAAGVGVLLAHHVYMGQAVPSSLRVLAWVTFLTAVVFFWVSFQVIEQIN